jgi:hypothetical protein
MFQFTEEQYNEFYDFLRELNKTNWGAWDTTTWLHYEGLPGYSINQYEQTNGKTFVVIKFDVIIKLPEDYDRKGKKFKVGGDRNYQPVCDRF